MNTQINYTNEAIAKRIDNLILEGSEKQVNWAKKIIGGYIYTLAMYLEKLDRVMESNKETEEHKELLKKSIEKVFTPTNASFVIDKRDGFERITNAMGLKMTKYLKTKTVLIKN